MIILTEAAKRRFHTLKPEEQAEGQALRLDRARATAHNGNEPVEHQGDPLLYVSRKVSSAFEGCVVDLMETPEGVGFAIGPPEAGRDARS